MTAHLGVSQTRRVIAYEIVVRGRLSQRYQSAFDGATLTPRPGFTVLNCQVRDKSQLYGLLDRLRDFGIELVSVNELPTGGRGR